MTFADWITFDDDVQKIADLMQSHEVRVLEIKFDTAGYEVRVVCGKPKPKRSRRKEAA